MHFCASWTAIFTYNVVKIYWNIILVFTVKLGLCVRIPSSATCFLSCQKCDTVSMAWTYCKGVSVNVSVTLSVRGGVKDNKKMLV